jgi:hypothetical protein
MASAGPWAFLCATALNRAGSNADLHEVRARFEIVVLALFGVAASVYLALWPNGVQDYRVDAGPSLHPLIHGDLHGAFAHEPAMGWFSIFFRAPVAFLARHGGSLAEYRAGVLPCLLVAAALGVWLAIARNRSLLLSAVVVALAVLGPMNWHAIADGHPEEILGGALCVAAVLTANRGNKPLITGIVLGLALATKQWAILAAGPTLIAAPSQRMKIAFTAAAIAAALTLAPVLAGSHGLLSPAGNVYGATHSIQPASLWWPFGQVEHLHVAAGWTFDKHVLPQWFSNLTHPLIVALGLLLPLAYAAKRRKGPSLQAALTMLSLLFLLRCVLDPMTVGYYHVPLLLALLALDALPLALVSNAVLWFLVARMQWGLEPGKVAAIYLTWALPTTGYLALKLYAPSVISDLGKWLSTSLPSSVTTTRSSIRTPNAPGT